MKTIPKFLFYLFLLLFFAFTLSFMEFQNYSMTGEGGGSRYWLMRIILVLDLVCITIFYAAIKRSYKGIHLVCMGWLLLMPLVMILNDASLSDTVQTILWPLIFETTYHLCCYHRVNRAFTMKNMYFVIAAVGASYFLATRLGADQQTNTIYFCFLTLPWLLYHAKSRNVIILLVVFTSLALLSMKRSVMLASVLMWLFFFLQRLKSTRNIIYTIILFLALFVGISVLYDRLDSQFGGRLTERVNREETDKGHDRMAIWNLTFMMIQESSTEQLITGHGHFGVRKNSFLEISAHNDFLEVIYDYGLVIFFLYLCLWWHVIRRCYLLYKRQSSLFLPYGVTLSIFMVMSMVSHLILYANYFNYLVMFWGMTEAIIESENKKNSLKKRLAR